MPQKVLVIDDERAIRSALKDILSFEGSFKSTIPSLQR